MPIHILTLKDRKTVANDTVQFHFEKPEGFNFVPGQYGGFTLINPVETDERGNTRRFSFLSTPNDHTLDIVTRIQKSAFKRNLMNLKPGEQVKMAGPTGTFTLHPEREIPAVFIAGGIGIAPFYSMINHLQQEQQLRNITLFYGNQTPNDTAFLAELYALQEAHPGFKFIPTMALPDNSWFGENGFIDEFKIRDYVPEITAAHYYICGSPAMVASLQNIVTELGVIDEQIHVEDFPGY